ncbi:hypothetical protein NKI32_24660 [Mesorhizobium sp. M0761]|uniref:hypothetical protein n=1 Tax=Mesorhizobium sp. M0761 TaxID=2956994 RepID=UPI00333C4845
MKVCVCHLPKGACVLKRSPFGAQPVRLVSLVLVDVSSMKISRQSLVEEALSPPGPQLTRLAHVGPLLLAGQ